jgi:hypothetical protein
LLHKDDARELGLNIKSNLGRTTTLLNLFGLRFVKQVTTSRRNPDRAGAGPRKGVDVPDLRPFAGESPGVGSKICLDHRKFQIGVLTTKLVIRAGSGHFHSRIEQTTIAQRYRNEMPCTTVNKTRRIAQPTPE